MRPELLNPLFAETTTLPGVGPNVARLIARAAGERVVDLLWHLPAQIIPRNRTIALGSLTEPGIYTLSVIPMEHKMPDRPGRPWRMRCTDGTGSIDLIWFNVRGDWLKHKLPIGKPAWISGKVELYQSQPQMPHPDYIASDAERHLIPVFEPVYGLTAGLANSALGRFVQSALKMTPALPEWLEESLLAREKWPTWRDALRCAHLPQTGEDISAARRRLAYDEILANQLAIAMVRKSQLVPRGVKREGDGVLRAALIRSLPFTLTGAQERAVAEIVTDLAAPLRMVRLLQGDVGSGKTLVALLAMLAVVESGEQAALMAPTEILARQHHQSLSRMLAPLGIEIACLTGRDKGKERAEILDGLADGRIRLVVGTHALFQESVSFAGLGLTVIDEQHRFGVHQRMRLSAKGQAVDVLVMTATPIPRTLTLTLYGDMAVSRLNEKPPGRMPIDTRVIAADKLPDIIAGIGRAVADGARVYWVCPLVSDSELLDLAAAEQRFTELSAIFPQQVGLIHGKMPPAEKDRVMTDFATGKLSILVATTVIEVGVDVPEANIMVIEHAERFGLAQLHQLRGRVGRGSAASRCLLVYSPPLGEISRARLEMMRQSEDGFLLAEEDLRLRGPGDVMGTKQSGDLVFHLCDIAEQGDLLQMAHDEARLILHRDPDLTSARGQNLRVLLYLFERDAAIRYLRAG